MEQKAGTSYSHSADFAYIDSALKARWADFLELTREFEAFKPKPAADFDNFRKSELQRLAILNPEASEESLLKLVNGQVEMQANPGIQVATKFSDRIMSEYVTAAFLSHALAEAAINTILAIGLARAGAEEVFSLLERADIKEKWVAGPKAFHPTYSLSKAGALYQTLHHLTRQRNVFVHYKIELEMDGEKKLKGSLPERVPMVHQLQWIHRFFSLPYDLASHARAQMSQSAPFILYDSTPIERFSGHLPTSSS